MVPLEEIRRLIHVVRAQSVMLDSDLARLYGVEVKQLKRQVRRNADRFPSDFMLVLTSEESAALRCQFGTLERGRHAKYQPFAFTEQGVAMLSSVLKSRHAVQANIAIMRAFINLRRALKAGKGLARRLEKIERRLTAHGMKLGRHSRRIGAVFEEIRRLMDPPEEPRQKIGFVAGGKI